MKPSALIAHILPVELVVSVLESVRSGSTDNILCKGGATDLKVGGQSSRAERAKKNV